MNNSTRNIDTLMNALAELDELLRNQALELAEIMVELLDYRLAQKIMSKSKDVLEWLAERLQELTDGAEALDVLAALAEVALDMFRFFKTIPESINLPGLTELSKILPSGEIIDNIQQALEWLPDPVMFEDIRQRVFALIDPSNGGINLVLQHIESTLNITN